MQIKVGLAQMRVGANKELNLCKAAEMVRQAVAAKAELVVLPEMFNCPYQSDCFVEFAETENGMTVQFLAGLAKDLQCFIVGGTIPERDGAAIFNTAFVFDRKGEIIAKHRKLHLFDVDIPGGVSFQESAVLSAGNQVTTFATEFGRFGLAICYDIRFPEVFRLMAEDNVTAVIIPAAFNLTTGPVHWGLLFKARAVDNQVYMLGVSQARNDQAEYHAYGHSIVVDPWAEVCWEADENEGLGIVTLDSERVDQIRTGLPLLQHRRLDLYQIKRQETGDKKF